MEFKGTKGDWATGLFPNLNHPHRTVLTEDGVEICTIHLDNEEVRANAKVMAASKDLLEALQELLIHSLENDLHSVFTDNAKKAIAKALN